MYGPGGIKKRFQGKCFSREIYEIFQIEIFVTIVKSLQWSYIYLIILGQ